MLVFPIGGSFSATFVRPLVYLDHWAMRHFADEASARSRLLGIIGTRGHLALSTTYLYEMAMQDDGPSIDAMRSLLTDVGERFWPIEPNATRVARRMTDTRMKEVPAALDRETVKMIAIAVRPANGIVTASMLFDIYGAHKAAVRAGLDDVKKGIKTTVDEGRQRLQAGHPIRQASSGPRCLQCLDALLHRSFADSKDFERNDALDLVHAAVPIAICDFVLLDGKWKRRVDAIPKPPRRADVFSGKKGQIEEFLAALERAPSKSMRDR